MFGIVYAQDYPKIGYDDTTKVMLFTIPQAQNINNSLKLLDYYKESNTLLNNITIKYDSILTSKNQIIFEQDSLITLYDSLLSHDNDIITNLSKQINFFNEKDSLLLKENQLYRNINNDLNNTIKKKNNIIKGITVGGGVTIIGLILALIMK